MPFGAPHSVPCRQETTENDDRPFQSPQHTCPLGHCELLEQTTGRSLQSSWLATHVELGGPPCEGKATQQTSWAPHVVPPHDTPAGPASTAPPDPLPAPLELVLPLEPLLLPLPAPELLLGPLPELLPEPVDPLPEALPEDDEEPELLAELPPELVDVPPEPLPPPLLLPDAPASVPPPPFLPPSPARLPPELELVEEPTSPPPPAGPNRFDAGVPLHADATSRIPPKGKMPVRMIERLLVPPPSVEAWRRSRRNAIRRRECVSAKRSCRGKRASHASWKMRRRGAYAGPPRASTERRRRASRSSKALCTQKDPRLQTPPSYGCPG
jgi:hypothetical protein